MLSRHKICYVSLTALKYLNMEQIFKLTVHRSVIEKAQSIRSVYCKIINVRGVLIFEDFDPRHKNQNEIKHDIKLYVNL